MNFLSVSGVTNAEELDAVAGIYCELQSPTDLLIGYQVSHKSIKERVKNSRQPYVTELPALTKKTCENGLFPAIHYFTRDNNTILDDLEWLVTEGVPPGLLQFNTLPPSVEILSEVKKRGFQTIFKVAVASPAGYAVWKDGNAVDVTSGNIEPLVDQVLQRKDVFLRNV